MPIAKQLRYETTLQLGEDRSPTDPKELTISIGTEFLYNQALVDGKFVHRRRDGKKMMRDWFYIRTSNRQAGVLSREFSAQPSDTLDLCFYVNITILVSWRDHNGVARSFPILIEDSSNNIKELMTDCIPLRDLDMIQLVASAMPDSLSWQCSARLSNWIRSQLIGNPIPKIRNPQYSKLH